ncbi:hypothetical protein [Lactobacillus sp. ESL0230]|uniref:DUF6895 family protein n=1 Tax=Lactobacillus sp. ESL0230 TaxID=2069353 RepID=UPI000EFBD74A|nr:hypothetical protein [Lactobacillus sp. ESL0230]RMC46720.1 hypothetical protein F5ESL0230_05570 [Lactobacillus sp. ESL0230]
MNIQSKINVITKEIKKNSEIWLNNNFNFFDITKGSNVISDELQFKAFIELLFTVDMFYPDKIFSKNLMKKIYCLSEKVEKEVNFTEYFLTNSALVAGDEEMIIFFKNYLNRTYKERERFQKIVSSDFELLARKTPYRILDSAYSMTKAEINNNAEDIDLLYNLTVLSNENFNYLYLSDNSAYSVTHTIFYATDMGRKHPSYLNYPFIFRTLRKMIIFYSMQNNVDIMGECVLGMSYLTGNNNTFNEQDWNLILFALNCIRNRQSKSGFIHSPSDNKEEQLTKEELFFDNYHTTLVNLGVAYAMQR